MAPTPWRERDFYEMSTHCRCHVFLLFLLFELPIFNTIGYGYIFRTAEVVLSTLNVLSTNFVGPDCSQSVQLFFERIGKSSQRRAVSGPFSEAGAACPLQSPPVSSTSGLSGAWRMTAWADDRPTLFTRGYAATLWVSQWAKRFYWKYMR